MLPRRPRHDPGDARIVRAAALARRAPALFGLSSANEIPPDIVRWHGPDKVAEFLRELGDEVKQANPLDADLVRELPVDRVLDLATSSTSSPSTSTSTARPIPATSRLQNLAVDKPLVLTEFGVDSLREGQEKQAKLSAGWCAPRSSAASPARRFAWTDDCSRTTRRSPTGSSASSTSTGSRRRRSTRFSSSTNAAAAAARVAAARVGRHLRVQRRAHDGCASRRSGTSTTDYEVIVVNDGSTDRTPAITAEHKAALRRRPTGPRMIAVDQPNRGLSIARNVGMETATGDIIAYTDSTACPDPDWLYFLVYKFLRNGFVAVGGRTSRRPSRASCQRPAPARPVGRRTCS